VKVRLLHQAGTGDPERAWSVSILWSDKPATEEMRNGRASSSSSPGRCSIPQVSALVGGRRGTAQAVPGGRSPRSRPWSTGMSGRSVPSVTARWPKPLLLTVAQPIAKGAGYFEPAPGRSLVVVWTIDGASLQAEMRSFRVDDRSRTVGQHGEGLRCRGSPTDRWRRRRSSSRATSPAAPPTLAWALRWPDRQRCRSFDRVVPGASGRPGQPTAPVGQHPGRGQGAWPGHAGPVGQRGGDLMRKLVVLALVVVAMGCLRLRSPTRHRRGPSSPS
jgi:hypothetical protein